MIAEGKKLADLDDIMAAVCQGSQIALRDLLHGYGQQLHRLADLILGDTNTAEDVVQETLISVWNHRRQYHAGKAAWPWISRILRNRCYAVWRKGGRHGDRPCHVAAELAEYVPARSPPPDQAAQNAEFVRLARTAMVELPPRLREAVRLALVAELSDEQIAAMLAIPVGTVKSRKNRGLAQLRARLTALPNRRHDHDPL